MQILIDELPKSCVGCKYFAEHRRQCNLELCLQWNEVKFKFNDCPLIDIKDHDREKDKQIKELEQKVQELQEIDNKRAFRLYSVLYNVLERQDPENVASRIEYMTSENYADICELYKTAKNLKQHDRELVKEVLEKVSIELENETETYCEIRQCNSPHYQGDYIWFNYVKFRKLAEKLQKEYEDGE